MDMRRALAILSLGWRFLVHLAQRLGDRLFGRPRPALEVFAERYRADGISFVTPEERARMPALGECTACRLCDPVCPVMPLPREAGRGFVGPSRLLLSSHRLPTAAREAWVDPFLCVRCGACEAACPEGVALDALIGGMRSAVAREAPEEVPAGLRDVLARAELRGHIRGDPPAAPRREDGLAHDHTYVPSCAASARDVAAETSLLEAAGVDFGTAPARCCGALAERGLGARAAGLAAAFEKGKVLHVVTSDPRCYEHMRGSAGYRDVVVRHVLELLGEGVGVGGRSGVQVQGQGKGQGKGEGGGVGAGSGEGAGSGGRSQGEGAGSGVERVTFHDPCQLVRVPGGAEMARGAIRGVGASLVEMRRHGRDAPCCGMGGATWTFAPELSEALGRERIREALATGAAVLLTQSPLCRDHLARCAAKEGAALRVENVTEMLAERAGVALPPRETP